MSSFKSGLTVVLCAVVAVNVAPAAERSIVSQAKSATGIIDLSLTPSGNLLGRYVDGEGRGIDGAIAVITQRRQVIAKTSTDRAGAYQFHGVASGVYQLTVGNVTHIVRVWPSSVAPSAARPLLTSVRGDQVIRGQFGGGAVDLGLIVGIAGLTVGTVAYVEAEDAKDEADKLRQQMSSLSGSGTPASP